jgi:hypothetical protein
MHLLGPAFTTTNTSKRKSKLSDTQYTRYAFEWRADCKRCKRLGIKSKTLEEYISYRLGNYKPKLRGTPMPNYNVSDHRKKYPSYGDQVGTIAAKPEMAYSGERKLLGIGTMHKSNMVPIFEKSDAEDIAKMRRN